MKYHLLEEESGSWAAAQRIVHVARQSQTDRAAVIDQGRYCTSVTATVRAEVCGREKKK